MKKLKVMTVVGTRPEIIRLSRVIFALDIHCDHVLVHTGQNYDYELNEIFFDDLGIRKPDHFLNAAGKNGAETIGKVIIGLDPILVMEEPDALLVLGDTNSCMSVLTAKRRKIPTFHMEAGNRCFDMRVPEEINRRIVDHTADVNLPYSDIARDYLLREGLPPDLIIKTGSPMYEVLANYKNKIVNSEILSKLNLEPGKFFIVSAHREENIDSESNFTRLVSVLNAIAKTYKIPVIVSAHPRTQNRIDALQCSFDKNVKLIKPLGFSDYNKLQLSSKAVLSDSGTINEESSILNFPALNLREAHERPEGMEEATVMMVGLSEQRVMQGLAILERQSSGQDRSARLVADYSMPNVSEKVVRIILSYTDYVNRTVWKKY
ncbi:UDP-N-acetylglucosamine 2-epimerase (non-hydrolyzing) [Luminiphilus sp.]|jgi:UDP-N-acetylglucosamine 2-epimerase|nr:UDP-N-acetylglucosamine 2-epimerase (non-hydrolyzing) [Luminiphilus sp.]MDB2378561.1 UDP-N-acetylglucosamine 2-epimerase (non-hydrolyzing) [Luminiphilus sp.]